jgi:hypothetical protein
MNANMMHMKKSARGFTLLLAVLISSILIALGAALYDIVSKEILLSSAGRESQFAFYAADTGIECALYWDSKGMFSSTSPPTSGNPIMCGGMTVNDFAYTPDTSSDGYTYSATFSFQYDGVQTNPCTTVQVVRTFQPSLQTTINSYGHNTCILSSPTRLERAIRVTY